MFKEKKNIIKRKIAIISTDKGQGCTRFSLMLYRYIKVCLKKEVCLVSTDIFKFIHIAKYAYMEAESLEIDVKARFTLSEVIENKAEYIIFDYGKNYEIDDLIKCDRIFCIIDINFWKVSCFENFMSVNARQIIDRIEFLYSFGEKEIQDKLQRVYKIDIRKIPNKSELFCLDMDIYVFMKNILKIY